MDQRISVSVILSDAWELIRKNIWILLGFTAVQFFFGLLIKTVILAVFEEESPLSFLIQNVLLSLFDFFFIVAFYQVIFKLIDEETRPDFPDFIPNLLKAVNFMIVILILGIALMAIIGIISTIYYFNSPEINLKDPLSWENLPFFILMGIPVVFFSIRFCFTVCFIVDQDSSSSEAISQSWTLTKGYFWFIGLLFLVIFGLNILFLIATSLLTGIFFTIPFSSIILIIAYRHLVNNYTDEEEIMLNDPEDKHGN
jgi:hypothetical protein